MEFKDLDYNLPKENIALYPEERGKSKLLVCFKKKGSFIDEKFSNLVNYIDEDSLLILNNTKVFNARVYFNLKSGKRGEALILEYKGKTMKCLLNPAKKILKEDKINFTPEIESKKIEKDEEGNFIVKINFPVKYLLKKAGVMPLPPYIKRKVLKEDNIWYQTVYAKKTGSIAAPTAGLHFTKDILNQLKEKKIKILYLILHVGVGTFLPPRVKNIEEHKMKKEYFEISKNLAYQIGKAKNEKRKIIAVGTTTARALEGSYLKGKGKILPAKDWTDLFIYPGYEFKVIDGLITNFHLPKSTPLCLVSAFAGIENVKKWYMSAINSNYRFLSYGDAMLII